MAGNTADVEQKVLLLPVPLYHERRRYSGHPCPSLLSSSVIRWGAKLGPIQNLSHQARTLHLTERLPGAHRVFCKFQDIRSILGPRNLGENLPQPSTAMMGSRMRFWPRSVVLETTGSGCSDPGCFLTGKVILVVDDLAPGPLLPIHLRRCRPLFLLTIPVSGILIDVCYTCILVENFNDLGCVPAFS